MSEIQPTKPVENTLPEIDYKAAYEKQQGESAAATTKMTDLQNQLNSVLAHNEKVLGEKKAEQAKRIAADDDQARKKGDFEQLLQSSEAKNKELAEQFKVLNSRISGEKIQREALKIATSLADKHNADLLSEFISKRLKYTDDGLKVLDRSGQLTVSTVDDLKNEFLSDEKYKSLLRGIQSNGGGATGSGSSASATKEMKRVDFEAMDMKQRHTFIIKDKGKVVD